jgi:hypothetical protein
VTVGGAHGDDADGADRCPRRFLACECGAHIMVWPPPCGDRSARAGRGWVCKHSGQFNGSVKAMRMTNTERVMLHPQRKRLGQRPVMVIVSEQEDRLPTGARLRALPEGR